MLFELGTFGGVEVCLVGLSSVLKLAWVCGGGCWLDCCCALWWCVGDCICGGCWCGAGLGVDDVDWYYVWWC